MEILRMFVPIPNFEKDSLKAPIFIPISVEKPGVPAALSRCSRLPYSDYQPPRINLLGDIAATSQ